MACRRRLPHLAVFFRGVPFPIRIEGLAVVVTCAGIRTEIGKRDVSSDIREATERRLRRVAFQRQG
jgi:hypothetical protein